MSDGYLTVDEVVESVKGFEPSDKSKKAIEGFIQDESSIVDSILSQRYQLPIKEDDYSEAYRTIKAIVRYAVLVRLELFLKIKTTDKKGSQGILDSAKFQKKYEMMITMIEKGTLQLKGVPRAEGLVSFSFPKRQYCDQSEGHNW